MKGIPITRRLTGVNYRHRKLPLRLRLRIMDEIIQGSTLEIMAGNRHRLETSTIDLIRHRQDMTSTAGPLRVMMSMAGRNLDHLTTPNTLEAILETGIPSIPLSHPTKCSRRLLDNVRRSPAGTVARER